ncbi:MAG: hypothetical protein II600_00150, partial [Bacteroidaceae bacterium]|nr:hypothetical protein [Bacteroidaceae bacterium]
MTAKGKRTPRVLSPETKFRRRIMISELKVVPLQPRSADEARRNKQRDKNLKSIKKMGKKALLMILD